MSWTTQDMPDLTGRRAVVTGVTGGLGFHTALELGRRGAELVVTARNPRKAEDTLARLRSELPDAAIEVLSLDLADLGDVERAARELSEKHDRVDLLVNNAGIMIPPKSTTADGFELQMGTNHLGHFAFTARLWPLLRASEARVVTISSIAHTAAKGIDLRALTPEGSPRRYRRWHTYGESKLANLIFAQELHRRSAAAGAGVTSVAAHPGYAATELQQTGLKMGNPLLGAGLFQISKVVGQSAAAGALPTLRAATDPALTGGEYVGPHALGGMRGKPVLVGMTRWARDEQLARDLWAASERATGLRFDVA